MKRSPNPFLAVIFVLAFSALGYSSATRYIAQSAGTFSGGTVCNGQATISAATFNSTTNGPGDVDYVCGTITGSAGGNVLTVVGSGSSGNPIKLTFDTGASLSAPYCASQPNGSACLIISTVNRPQSYIVVDGGTPCGWTNAGGPEAACNGTIVNTAIGSSLTYTSQSTTAIEAEKCTGCEIKNLGIYDLYVEHGGATNADPQYENCISYSGSNLLIHDNRMHDVGWCLFYRMQVGDNNISIYQNEIYNTPHPMFFGNAGGIDGTATNQFVYSNHFHDYANWNTPSCTFHVEGIHTSGPSTAPFPVFNGLYIYNNYFGPNEGSCLFSQVYFSPNTGKAGSPALVNKSYVFNNVIEQSETGEIAITIGGGTGNAVYNNTLVYDTPNTSNAGLNWSNISQNSGYNFTYKNNAMQGFYTMVNNDVTGSEGSGIIADYNVYSSCASGHGSCLQSFVPNGTSSWAPFMANSWKQELHSQNTGLWNGGYCCSGSLGLNSSFAPTPGSPVINAGTNLYSFCNGQPTPGLGALCYDFSNVARPSSGAWTAGAYQGASSQQGPAPPTALTAVGH